MVVEEWSGVPVASHRRPVDDNSESRRGGTCAKPETQPVNDQPSVTRNVSGKFERVLRKRNEGNFNITKQLEKEAKVKRSVIAFDVVPAPLEQRPHERKRERRRRDRGRRESSKCLNAISMKSGPQRPSVRNNWVDRPLHIIHPASNEIGCFALTQQGGLVALFPH